MKMKCTFLPKLIGSLMFCVGACAAAERYPSIASFDIDAMREEPWYKQCLSVQSIRIEAEDLPPSPALKAAGSCKPEDLYYDTMFDHRADPFKANWLPVVACAYSEQNESVLMMLFANGLGVRQNLRLALRMACSMGGAPAEVSGRVEHLSKWMEDPGLPEPDGMFDKCDDITSGLEQGHCTAIQARQAARSRARIFDSYRAKLTSPERVLFSSLMKATEEFASARGDSETDLSGTARAAFSIGARTAVLEEFTTVLLEMESGKLPRFSSEDFQSLDGELNQVYRRVFKLKAGSQCFGHLDSKTAPECGIGFSTILKSDVRETQRAWLRYRDAWVEFARKHHPNLQPYALKALLTKSRVAQLAEILELADE